MITYKSIHILLPCVITEVGIMSIVVVAIHTVVVAGATTLKTTWQLIVTDIHILITTYLV